MLYEYKVIPAPTKGLKAKGVKTSPDRFANALQTAINVLAGDGWEYVRAETLPSEEREGLMGKTTVFQNMLIFRKPLEAEVAETMGALPPPEEKSETVEEDLIEQDEDAVSQTEEDGEPEEAIATELKHVGDTQEDERA